MCSMLKVFATVVVLLEGSILHCAERHQEKQNQVEEEDFYLPSDTRPEKYLLNLHTDIHDGNFNFTARVNIQISVLEATDSIVLYTHNFTFTKIALNDANGNEVYENIEPILDYKHEVMTLPFEEALIKDEKYEIDITYSGLFPSDFIKSQDESHLLLISFDSVKFRSICPSYDVYDVRSVYEIEIKHHSSYHALSNADVVEDIGLFNDDNFITTRFKPTESILTSSLAIIVSKFKSISSDQIEIYGKGDYIDADYYKYSLEMVANVINVSQNYFISYNMSNIKYVAISNIVSDTPAFQLVINNHNHLFYQADTSMATQRDKILCLFTRTIAQQYFGNIVSMSTLADTFLTEGLARYFEYFIANTIDGERINFFNSEILHPALEFDSLPLSRTLSHSREAAIDEINEFSAGKSASIFKMFANAIGDEKFKRIVQNFIEKFKFQDVTSAVFYIDVEADFDVEAFFDLWTTNVGYPLITIKSKTSISITITQERFQLYNLNCDSCDQLWTVPIKYLLSNNDTGIIWLSEEELTVDFPETDWMIFNLFQIGYYRVNYDEESWKQIINLLNDEENFTKIPILNRAALIDDAMNLAYAEKISYSTVFNLLSYLKHESEFIPWRAAANAFDYLDMMLFSNAEMYAKFKTFIASLVNRIYVNYGHELIEDEDSNSREMRKIAMNWAYKIGLQSCTNFVNENFHKILDDTEHFHDDIKSIIVCNGIRNVNQKTFNETMNKMLQSDDSRQLFIQALACTEDRESLSQLIQLISFSDTVTDYDKRNILIASMKNYRYSADAGHMLKLTYLSILTKSEIDFMLTEMIKRFWNNQLLSNLNDTLNGFMSVEKLTIDEKNLYYEMGKITSNQWMNNNRDEISNWLNENVNDEMTTTTTTTTEISTTNTDSTTELTTPDCAISLHSHKLLIIFLIIYHFKTS